MENSIKIDDIICFLQNQGYGCTYEGYKINKSTKQIKNKIQYKKGDSFIGCHNEVLKMNVYNILGDLDSEKEVLYKIDANEMSLKVKYYGANFDIVNDKNSKNLTMLDYHTNSKKYNEDWTKFLIEKHPGFASDLIDSYQSVIVMAQREIDSLNMKFAEKQLNQNFIVAGSTDYYEIASKRHEEEIDSIKSVIYSQKQLIAKILSLQKEVDDSHKTKEENPLEIFSSIMQ